MGKSISARRYARMKAIAESKRRHPTMPDRWHARNADNPQTCSGPCCGNRRKYDGPSIAERRMTARERNQ